MFCVKLNAEYYKCKIQDIIFGKRSLKFLNARELSLLEKIDKQKFWNER